MREPTIGILFTMSRVGAGIAAALALSSCHANASRRIQLSVGPKAGQSVEFIPTVSFAEYVEPPKAGSELTLTFADYSASCEQYVPPAADQVLLTVVIASPKVLSPGTYPWAGHAAHGGTVERPLSPYALPSVRLGSHAYRIEPGGGIALQGLELRPGGEVRGLLGFEFPGTIGSDASRIAGAFSARICRFAR